GVARMEEAWRSQFLPDGVHGELTPGYHALGLLYYLDLAELVDGKALPPELADGVQRMRAFVAAMTKPDGQLFRVGDTHPTGDDPVPLLARASRVLGARPVPRCSAFPAGGFYTFQAGTNSEA